MINAFKKSLLLKTIHLILKHKKYVSYIFLLDILFLIFLGGFSFITTQLLPKNPTDYLYIFNSANTALAFSILVALVYLSVLLLIYSFFKYGVLDMIHSCIRKTDFDFSGLKKFYQLNIAILVGALLIFVAVYALSLAVFYRQFALLFMWLVILVMLIFLYPLFNIAHCLFTKNYPVKKILKKSLKLTINIKSYLPTYGIFIVIPGVFVLCF